MSIPIPTIKRFPSYLRILNQAKDAGKKYISATNLADELGLNPIQVRKDISSTGIEGKPKIGFDIEELIHYITHVLGWDNTTDALIVGAGNLGSAIARYDGFASYGLKIVAIFDKSTEKIGTSVGSFTVKSMESLNRFIMENRISIAVITVPATQAQAVCDLLVKCGIRGIWNFAPKDLRVPESVVVQRTDLATSFAVLSVKLSKKLAESDDLDYDEDMI